MPTSITGVKLIHSNSEVMHWNVNHNNGSEVWRKFATQLGLKGARGAAKKSQYLQFLSLLKGRIIIQKLVILLLIDLISHLYDSFLFDILLICTVACIKRSQWYFCLVRCGRCWDCYYFLRVLYFHHSGLAKWNLPTARYVTIDQILRLYPPVF